MRTFDLSHENDRGHEIEEAETELQYLVRKLWGPQATMRFAQACRVNPKTARHWLNGRNEVPEAIVERLRG